MLVQALRGGLSETVHTVRAVAVGLPPGAPLSDLAHTAPLWQSGPPTKSTWRSAAKPLQLWCSLEALGDPVGLTDDDLAIGASSHSGQPGHLDAVRRVLARFDLDEALLACGAEPPAHRPSARELLRQGSPPLPIHNDCSGKHAFMLAACRAQGWPLQATAGTDQGYLALDHPLHQRIGAASAAWTGDPAVFGVDGCGVPVLHLSVLGMARAWARLAAAVREPDADPRLAAIGRAMIARPWSTSGDGRLDLALADRAREPWVGKIGARGVFCIALPARGLGIALKVLDGDEDALAVAVPAVVDAVAPGALAAADDWPWSVVRNVAGRPVGVRRCRA
ncbi:MAG: asparaginase [Alphaproteobacteria bacterium]|nr:asparaginase [Alphaproteobacteria bacterium]